jgi:hypothetical protein
MFVKMRVALHFPVAYDLFTRLRDGESIESNGGLVTRLACLSMHQVASLHPEDEGLDQVRRMRDFTHAVLGDDKVKGLLGTKGPAKAAYEVVGQLVGISARTVAEYHSQYQSLARSA